MPKYSAESRIPSCRVERDLLGELEDYVRRKATELAPSRIDRFSEDYEITIQDSVGSEKLTSIQEFRRSYFPNDTKSVAIAYREYSQTSLGIAIKFSLEKEFATLKVSFQGEAAREVVAGISAEIVHILRNYRTTNFIFHPHSIIKGVTGILTVFVLLPITVSALTKNLEIGTVLIAISSSIGFYLILGKIKPYSMFQTKRNESLEKWSTWLILGFLGFLLFSVIGIFLRKKFLGF